ncbi:MAG: hypothetical protein LBN06_04455 [Prevotellaceae bacterium]|jgi:hypothetical protein|nr:hypothetical protein [Prevotellaceae bacterium]
MSTKKYKMQETTEQTAAEPLVAYGSVHQRHTQDVYVLNEREKESIRISEEQFARGEYYTEEEVDAMFEQWCAE